MKRNEAEDVYALMAAMYDLHPERAGEQSKVWVPALEHRDAVATMDVIGRWMEGRGAPERFPSIGVFVAIVKSEEAKLRPPVFDCDVCVDGYVEVGIRRFMLQGRLVDGVEQMAPCPKCDIGKLIEHPLEAKGPWGSDGFWHGQPWEPVRQGVVELAAAS